MLWLILLVIISVALVFSLVTTIGCIIEDSFPKATPFFTIPVFVVSAFVFKTVLFKESNVSTFYAPTSYSINEEAGVGYFYLNEHSVSTKEYLHLKAPQEVKIEALVFKRGIAPFEVSGTTIYKLSLNTNNTNNVEN